LSLSAPDEGHTRKSSMSLIRYTQNVYVLIQTVLSVYHYVYISDTDYTMVGSMASSSTYVM